MTTLLEKPLAAPAGLLEDLTKLLGARNVICNADELVCYDCDGFTVPRAGPLAVVFPTSTELVSRTLKLLKQYGVAVLPRGAGTGKAGGIVSVSEKGSVQVSTARMTKILEIDLRNRWALVEAGVANTALSVAIADSPYHFAPDPASQRAATIGGNVATNAGGLHTLKHGVTINHILGIEFVLSDGSVHQHGGPSGHDLGPDFTGLFSGTEGTLGLITRVWCRLVPRAKSFRTAMAFFDATNDACNTVAQIIAAGITPAALEMMDGQMLKVVEEAFHFGFPADAQGMLLIEVDGIEEGLDAEMAQIAEIAKANHARDFRIGSDAQTRANLWMARKKAFGALGQLGYSYCTQDACVPRSTLPKVLAEIAKIAKRFDLFVPNCFHAGDGNVHPMICYDGSNDEQVKRVLAASGEILKYCISVGGTITGEHGVGIEKVEFMSCMFSPVDLEMMHRIRQAMAPDDGMNPYKVLPREGAEIDMMHPQRHGSA